MTAGRHTLRLASIGDRGHPSGAIDAESYPVKCYPVKTPVPGTVLDLVLVVVDDGEEPAPFVRRSARAAPTARTQDPAKASPGRP